MAELNILLLLILETKPYDIVINNWLKFQGTKLYVDPKTIASIFQATYETNKKHTTHNSYSPSIFKYRTKNTSN